MGLFIEPDRGGIVASVGKIADGFSKLVTQHIQLARMELAEDAKAMGSELGRMALFVPFVIVGYALLCGAAAMLLGVWLTQPGGFAVVGAANLVGGGLGIRSAVLRLRARDILVNNSLQELNRSAAVLSPDATRPTENPHG